MVMNAGHARVVLFSVNESGSDRIRSPTISGVVSDMDAPSSSVRLLKEELMEPDVAKDVFDLHVTCPPKSVSERQSLAVAQSQKSPEVHSVAVPLNSDASPDNVTIIPLVWARISNPVLSAPENLPGNKKPTPSL